MGFVQADPIRSPARAQDLILRHRVSNYRSGDLEKRYPRLRLEEEMLYAYGFMTGALHRHLAWHNTRQMTAAEKRILAFLKAHGPTHPRDLDKDFGRRRVVNAWGGFSQESKRALERLHRRGLLRVARREKGIRIYEPTTALEEPDSPEARMGKIAHALVSIFSPARKRDVRTLLGRIARRREWKVSGAEVLTVLARHADLHETQLGNETYLELGRAPEQDARKGVCFLAPFDPVVWDRLRFEQFWQWSYRFEAYTPAAKRVRGYYAMPLLWNDDVIGWANVSIQNDDLDVELGFVKKRPTSTDFRRGLEKERASMSAFLGLGG